MHELSVFRDYQNNCYRFEYKQRFTDITDFEIYRCFGWRGNYSVFLLKSLIRHKFNRDLKMPVVQIDVECEKLFNNYWKDEAWEL